MAILKVIVWSAACVGLGIFLATHSIDGKTPVEHAQKALNGKVKEDVEEAIDSARKKVLAAREPTEKHSVEDKDAVNKLIARRKP